MEIKISKWGNSMALRLPKFVVEDLKVQEGSLMNLFVKENKLIVEPVKRKYSLKELLKDVDKSNLHSETSTGISVGNEN